MEELFDDLLHTPFLVAAAAEKGKWAADQRG
jgi:hypothetical protein